MQTATAATKKLLISNLPEAIAPNSLRDLFNGIGRVFSVSLLADGFAFVEMAVEDADQALVQLNGYRWNGKAMMIDEAHPRSRSRY
jgi:RNA recognition motif-containing protein